MLTPAAVSDTEKGEFMTATENRNLIHHALELLIKFTLLKDVPELQQSAATTELRQKYGHRLDALWTQYKQHVAPADVSRFDRLIVDLDRWENVRYGGFPTPVLESPKLLALFELRRRLLDRWTSTSLAGMRSMT
jgi:hypothetical protein